MDNPIYTAYLVSGDAKYNLSSALVSISMTDQKNQFSQSARIELANIRVGTSYLTDIINVRDRVFIYANDGTRYDEVFRGFVWTKGDGASLTENSIELKCYDQLIYFQESEDSHYFAPGSSTHNVFVTICRDIWGVPLKYNYESITHSKLALRGTLADILTSDVLDIVKDRTNKDYVILSSKDYMEVRGLGSNSTVYSIVAGNNAVRSKREITMDGMVTKVIILGKGDDEGRVPQESSYKLNTSKYGILQKIYDRDENTPRHLGFLEAANIVNSGHKPFTEYEVECPDIPWIRKGDKVYVNAGVIKGKTLIAFDVDRTITNDQKKMSLTLKEAR